MSKKTSKAPSFKSLMKRCDEIGKDSAKHYMVISSPSPSATLASAILCKSMLSARSLFHLTITEPVLDIDTVNDIRKIHEKSTIFLVGIDVIGDKRVRKGKSYPVLFGSQSESEHASSLTLGTRETLAAAAYAYVESISEDPSSEEYLHLAAAGSLVDSFPNPKLKGASKELVESAKKKGLVEERKGFRLFGVNFMPLNEVLTFSIRPYLHNLSGMSDACDKLCTDADLPFSKFRLPLNALSKDEATRLTTHLIPMLEPRSIPLVLGQDFVLTSENEDSPVKLLSGIKAQAETAWSLGESGAAIAIWMGDRARILRSLLDSCMTYSRDAITSAREVIKNFTKLVGSDSSDSVTKIPVKSIQEGVFADVGRILIESGKVETKGVILSSEDTLGFVWRDDTHILQDVLLTLKENGLEPKSTSSQSIRLKFNPEEREETVRILDSVL